MPLTLPRPTSQRTVVVANQKGGVGKTTTAINFAVALAMSGLKVLVIDTDPQGNASTALGIDHEVGTPGTYEVLLDEEEIGLVAKPSPEALGLEVVPATIDLSGAELQLVDVKGRERRLRKALRKYLKNHDVDYVILDCPPSLGLLTLNALVAADEVLLPIQCEYYALEGVTQLMRTIEAVRHEMNKELRLVDPHDDVRWSNTTFYPSG
ncbi:chromosome (plasmid) partitioning protein ParA [Cutibacterium acnes JCM 18909]|nr:chromosome (plasmid) partitioning protein ParA [Cutibacterium acnes JCM 18909]